MYVVLIIWFLSNEIKCESTGGPLLITFILFVPGQLGLLTGPFFCPSSLLLLLFFSLTHCFHYSSSLASLTSTSQGALPSISSSYTAITIFIISHQHHCHHNLNPHIYMGIFIYPHHYNHSLTGLNPLNTFLCLCAQRNLHGKPKHFPVTFMKLTAAKSELKLLFFMYYFCIHFVTSPQPFTLTTSLPFT